MIGQYNDSSIYDVEVIPQLLQALNQTGKIPVRASDQDMYLFSLFYTFADSSSINYLKTGLVALILEVTTVPKSGVLGSIPGLATYFRFSFRFFKKGSCQLLAKVCARSTG